MKNGCVFLLLVLFSCGKKESVSLPQSNITSIKDVQDYSPIYLFFKTNGKDTLVKVNRKNAISSTNWIFHIDKRLPLRLVIPEIIKLQAKKEGSAHKSETSENYFSYSDSIRKNLAFLPFTKVNYQLTSPKGGELVFISKNGFSLEKLKKTKANTSLKFDKNLSFEKYLQYKIAIQKLNLSNVSKEEFVY